MVLSCFGCEGCCLESGCFVLLIRWSVVLCFLGAIFLVLRVLVGSNNIGCSKKKKNLSNTIICLRFCCRSSNFVQIFWFLFRVAAVVSLRFLVSSSAVLVQVLLFSA